MNRYIFLFVFVSFPLYSMTKLCEKKLYQEIYAESLVTEFDRSLNESVIIHSEFNLFENTDYQRLLALRSLIEESEAKCEIEFQQKSMMQLRNMKMYHQIIDEVETRRLEIETQIPKNEKNELLIFPSNTSNGNVTGNSFPKNTWALTFDDGPNPITTPKVLKNLKTHSMQATFFVLTEKALKNLKVIESIRDEHELALHSYTHANLSKSNANLVKEIHEAKDDLERETNVDLKLFRLPYGAGVSLSRVRTEITNANMIHLFWNIDTLDWSDKNPDSIVARALKLMKTTPHNSGVILFHDIHSQSVIASEKLMKILNETNQTVCTVGQIINGINEGLEGCLK